MNELLLALIVIILHVSEKTQDSRQKEFINRKNPLKDGRSSVLQCGKPNDSYSAIQYNEKYKLFFLDGNILEAFNLEVMRTNIKSKARQTKKIKANVCTAAQECQPEAPAILTGKHRKICAGCSRQRDKSQVLQSQANFETHQFTAKLIQKNPDKTSHPSLFLCIIILQ